MVDAPAATYEIQGSAVTLPVEVRAAANWSAQYLVPAAAAQRIVGPTGLTVAEPVPGRALLALAAVRYDDTDLGRYHEVAVSFVVRRHDAGPAGRLGQALDVARQRVGVYIHRLPVDQTFTLEAGRRIWGYPKTLNRINIDVDDRSASVRLEEGGEHVLTLRVATGGRLALPTPALPTYTYLDGVLRRTAWETHGTGVTGRLGGAHLTLGDHPMADELRSLGLPKAAVMSGAVAHVRATFGAAEVVAGGGRWPGG